MLVFIMCLVGSALTSWLKTLEEFPGVFTALWRDSESSEYTGIGTTSVFMS
jgi:hypothetical protein